MSWRKWQDANQKPELRQRGNFIHSCFFTSWSDPFLFLIFLCVWNMFTEKPLLLFSPCCTGLSNNVHLIWSTPHAIEYWRRIHVIYDPINILVPFFFFFFLDVLTRVVTCIKCMVKIYFLINYFPPAGLLNDVVFLCWIFYPANFPVVPKMMKLKLKKKKKFSLEGH